MVVIYIIIFAYVCFMIWLLDGYANLSKTYIHNKSPYVSIIVAAKNEENNISNLINSLIKQTYPKEKYEIIICNDQSTDNTAEIIEYYKNKFSNLNSINIKNTPNDWAGKKWALYNGIQKSIGEIILQTDADCVVEKNWIKSMVSQFSDESVGFVCGLTPLYNKIHQSFFNKVIFLDSIAQDAFIACGIGKGLTFSATGRNIAFRKNFFYQSNSYNQINNIISGDDDLLLHKIVYYANCKVKFILHKDSIVASDPPLTFNQFINQRLRFASKGFIYYKKEFISKELKILLPFLYLVNILTVISLSLFLYNLSFIYLLPFIFKIIPDIIYIHTFKNYYNLRLDLFVIIFTALIHPFYIISFGILGPIHNIKWK